MSALILFRLRNEEGAITGNSGNQRPITPIWPTIPTYGQSRSTDKTPLQPPIASEPQPQQDPPRRGPQRKIIGIAIVVSLIGIGLYVPRPLDWLSRSRARDNSGVSRLKKINVEGQVARELISLAGDNTLLVELGGSSSLTDSSGGGFKVKGHEDTTGLVSVSVGGKTIGLDVLPKPAGFPHDQPVLSYRSTALSLILLTPGVAVGDPVIDLLLRDAILSNPDIEALAASLAEEAQIEGQDYLDELSDASSRLRDQILQWFFYDPHASESGGPGSRKAISKGQVLVGSSSIPLSCDVGLIPLSRLEYDNVCFTVVNPSEDDWKTTKFPATLKIHVENRSPRWVAIFKADRNGRSDFVGAVSPKVWTPPNVEKLVFSTAARISLAGTGLKFLSVAAETRIRSNGEFELRMDANADDEIVTLSFGDSKDDDVDERISELGIQDWKVTAFALTMATNYVLPIVNILLDRGPPTKSGVLSGSCDNAAANDLWNQILLDFLGNETFIEPMQEFSRGLPGMDLQSLLKVRVFSRILIFMILDSAELACDKRATEYLNRFVDCISLLPKICDLPKAVLDVLGVYAMNKPDAAYVMKRVFKNLTGVQGVNTILGFTTLGASTLDLFADLNRFGNGSRYPISSLTSSQVCGELLKLFEPYSRLNESTKISNPLDFLNSIEEISGAIGSIVNADFFDEQAKAWERFESTAPIQIKLDVEEISRSTRELTELINKKGPVGMIAGIFSSNSDLMAALDRLDSPLLRVWQYYQDECGAIEGFDLGS